MQCNHQSLIPKVRQVAIITLIACMSIVPRISAQVSTPPSTEIDKSIDWLSRGSVLFKRFSSLATEINALNFDDLSTEEMFSICEIKGIIALESVVIGMYMDLFKSYLWIKFIGSHSPDETMAPLEMETAAALDKWKNNHKSKFATEMMIINTYMDMMQKKSLITTASELKNIIRSTEEWIGSAPLITRNSE